jgi:hypothetical protein
MTFKPDIDLFQNSLKELATLLGKSVKEVVLDEASFFARDSAKMMPPFGKTPIKESWAAQKRIGERAVGLQVNRAFKPLDWFEKWKNDKVVKGMLRMAKGRNFNPLAVENAIRQMGFKRIAGVIDRPTEEAHNASRGSDGRVRKRQAQWFVRKKSDVNKYEKTQLAELGKLKDGWGVAISAIDALRGKLTKLPPWITRHNENRGTLDIKEDNRGDFGLIATNAIPYGQKHASSAWEQAIKARYIGAQKRAYMILKAMERKARMIGRA